MRPLAMVSGLLCLCAALALSGCAGAGNSASNASVANAAMSENLAPTAAPVVSSEQARSLPVNASGEALVAKVNDAEITRTEFERTMARYRMLQTQAQDISTLRVLVLDTLIEQALIEQAATAQNVSVTDAELQAELDVNIQIAGGAEAWQQWLTSNMYTEAEFRETLRETLITNRMRDMVTQSVNGSLLQVHARHIVVETEAQASEVLARLQAGDDFAALAAQYSRDVTTRDQGGDLGWFAQEELIEPYLAQVAFSLEPGATAGPVPTMLGYHIIQVLERAERPVPEDKRPVLAQTLFERWLGSLFQTATIERYI